MWKFYFCSLIIVQDCFGRQNVFQFIFSNVNTRPEDNQNASRNGNRTYSIINVLTGRKFGVYSDVPLVYSIMHCKFNRIT